MSKAYTSTTLTELVDQARDLVHKEKARLWRYKPLLTKFSGDNTWIPCRAMEGDDDSAFFDDPPTRAQQRAKASSSYSTSRAEDAPGNPMDSDEQNHDAAAVASKTRDMNSTSRVGGHSNIQKIVGQEASQQTRQVQDEESTAGCVAADSTKTSKPMDGEMHLSPMPSAAEQLTESNEVPDDGVVIDDLEDVPIPRRMRTRAQAQADSENTGSSRTRSTSTPGEEVFLVNAYFLAPEGSWPDRNVGLPQHEADEFRRLLQLVVQKQEEICRNSEKLYEGLLLMERRRKLVWKWAKAAAHVGLNRDMSDGEDWYDKEEWGLTEDLKKGQDDDDDDTAGAGKKPRTRRQ